MKWRSVLAVGAFVAAANVVFSVLRGPAREIFVVLVVVLGAAAPPLWRWRWRRRLSALRALPREEAERAVARLPEWERAAARVALDLVTSADATATPDGRTFRYRHMPKRLREATFWFSVALAVLALGVALEQPAGGDRWYALFMGLFFIASVGYQLLSSGREREAIQVTSSGIRAVAADGTITGLLWGEVAWIRNQRLLGRVEIRALDDRRCIRVRYTLVQFTQFMELVVAHLKDHRERAVALRR